MRFTLKDYQSTAVGEVLRNLADAREDFHSRGRNLAFSLTATTGAGKTVMAAAVFEALFEGSEDLEFEADPTAVVLWMTDDPALNEQTRHRLTEASDRLSYSRLRVIADYGFDQEKFEPGHIYFLNRHKLTAKTFVTHSDKRTYTVWETIQNTIEDPNLTLYLVLDEAHRGMKAQSKAKSTEEEKDRASTILRLINGNDGMAPVPIVWGISATVERFNEAMKDARARTTLPAVTVDPRKVQESGLLKDDICLDIPDESGAFETTLLRQATLKIQESEAAWEEYAQRESLPDSVLPLLVVQVPNTPSESEMTRLLTTIYDEWPELADDAVANVFGEHKDETYGNFTVPYLSPEHVQDATHVRVLLAKDAISTGWDCPRAEVLCSLRPATDRTYITQMVGRMVRTPLARRIDSDPRLNAVSCFLPHFDKATTTRVVNALMGDFTDDDGSDRNKVPGRRVLINPKEMRWNKALPEGLADVFGALPTKAAPKAETKPIKRLLALAAAIGVDGLITDANDQVHARLYGSLDGQRAQHKDAVEAGVEDILTADIARITASKVTLTSTETTHQVAADALTVEDAFRLATRSLGAAIANGYVKNLATNNQPAGEDFDVHDAKAQVAALVRIDGVVQQVEAEANRLAADWFSALHARIKGLSEERRGVYTELKQQGREPQQFDLVVPTSRLEPSFEEDAAGNQVPVATRPKHLLSDEQGDFPVGKLGVGLELETLDIELARDETVAWYRNPSNATSDAVQVPWHDGQRWRSMQPDFAVFSTKADGSLVASIVDPHSHYLGDALGKLKGMAAFAEEFSGDFLRIESITFDKDGSIGPEFKGALCMLDMTEPTVRQAVQDASSATDAYRSAGQLYK